MCDNGVVKVRSDLHVNERQEIRHYRARSTEGEEEERQMAIFYFARRARKLRYYGAVIHSFYWKSAAEPDGGPHFFFSSRNQTQFQVFKMRDSVPSA